MRGATLLILLIVAGAAIHAAHGHGHHEQKEGEMRPPREQRGGEMSEENRRPMWGHGPGGPGGPHGPGPHGPGPLEEFEDLIRGPANPERCMASKGEELSKCATETIAVLEDFLRMTMQRMREWRQRGPGGPGGPHGGPGGPGGPHGGPGGPDGPRDGPDSRDVFDRRGGRSLLCAGHEQGGPMPPMPEIPDARKCEALQGDEKAKCLLDDFDQLEQMIRRWIMAKMQRGMGGGMGPRGGPGGPGPMPKPVPGAGGEMAVHFETRAEPGMNGGMMKGGMNGGMKGGMKGMGMGMPPPGRPAPGASSASAPAPADDPRVVVEAWIAFVPAGSAGPAPAPPAPVPAPEPAPKQPASELDACRALAGDDQVVCLLKAVRIFEMRLAMFGRMMHERMEQRARFAHRVFAMGAKHGFVAGVVSVLFVVLFVRLACCCVRRMRARRSAARADLRGIGEALSTGFYQFGERIERLFRSGPRYELVRADSASSVEAGRVPPAADVQQQQQQAQLAQVVTAAAAAGAAAGAAAAARPPVAVPAAAPPAPAPVPPMYPRMPPPPMGAGVGMPPPPPHMPPPPHPWAHFPPPPGYYAAPPANAPAGYYPAPPAATAPQQPPSSLLD